MFKFDLVKKANGTVKKNKVLVSDMVSWLQPQMMHL